jgi:hypothetical protein
VNSTGSEVRAETEEDEFQLIPLTAIMSSHSSKQPSTTPVIHISIEQEKIHTACHPQQEKKTETKNNRPQRLS